MAASQTVKVVFDGKDNTSTAINSLKGNLGKADAAVSKIKSSLGGMTGAIGLAAGAAGFGMLAKSALESADKLGKASERMQIAASDLSALQLAASYAGVETDAFTKLMEIFQKRIGEAAQGTGEAAGVLKQFGINAQEFAKLPLDEQLKIIADNMNTLEGATEKAAAASDLFSNRGIKLINFFNLGSAGIEKLREEFRALGLEISDDAIDSIESFNDSMTKVQAIVQQAMVVGLAQAAPQMEEFAQKAAAMAVPLVGDLLDGLTFIVENASTIATGIQAIVAAMVASKVIAFVTGVGQLTVALYGMATASTTVATALAPVGALLAGAGAIGYGIGTLINNATGASDAIADWAAELTGLNDRIEAAKNGTDGLSDSAGGYTGEADDAAGETVNLKNKIEDLQEVVVTASKKDIPGITTSVVTLAKEERDAAKETLELKEALEKLRDKALKPQRDLDDFIKKMEELQKQIEAGGEGAEDAAKSMKVLVGEFTGVTDEAEDLRQEIARVKTAIESMGEVTGENADLVDALNKKLEELGGELVEVTKQSGSFTKSQREVLEEVKKTENELNALNQKLEDLGALYKAGAISAGEYRKAVADVKAEISDLKDELSPLGQAIKDAFDGTAVGDFLNELNKITGTNVLDGLISDLGITKTAISDCFGTDPITNFSNAIKGLFGDGSAFGGFGDVLTGLTTDLGTFFTGAEGKFNVFKGAIIRTLEEIAAAAIASVGINFLKNLIPGIATGGLIEGYAVGGRVTGSGGPKEDKVLARLSAGEYVINAASVSKFGTEFFDMLNAGKLDIPGYYGGGLMEIPTFDPYSLVINSIMKYLIDELLQTIFGDDTNRKKSEYRAAFNDFTRGSFDLVNDNISAGFGIPKLYGRVMGGPGVYAPGEQPNLLEDEILPRIGAAILGSNTDDKPLDVYEKVVEALPDINTGFAESIYEWLARKIRGLQLDVLNFNLDDEVGRLFNSANQRVGGNLTLNARQFGGSLERGQASLVGEDGPELFVPDERGRVSPIARDGGRELIEAVIEVKQEVAALRRQMDRQNPVQLFGGRSA